MAKKIRYDLGDGRTACFSGKKFQDALWRYKVECQSNGEKMSLQKVIEELAEATIMSESAIKHWRNDRHVPSDFEKVEAIASFLNTNPENLLVIENEEEITMKTMNEQVSVMTMEKADYASSKEAVKNIYASMVGYIEMFRPIVRGDIETYAAEPLRAYFVPMYTQLMLARLDIPADTHKKLCSFVENYLQQMATYAWFLRVEKEGVIGRCMEMYEDGDAPWWGAVYAGMDENSEDAVLFSNTMVKQFQADEQREESVWYDICEGNVIIDTAYTRLEEILADYMVK